MLDRLREAGAGSSQNAQRFGRRQIGRTADLDREAARRARRTKCGPKDRAAKPRVHLLTSTICIVTNIENEFVPLLNDHVLLDVMFFYFNVPIITVFDAVRLSEISLIDSDTQVAA